MTGKKIYSQILKTLCLIGVVRGSTALASLPSDKELHPMNIVRLQEVLSGRIVHGLAARNSSISVDELINSGIVFSGDTLNFTTGMVSVEDLERAGALKSAKRGYLIGKPVSLEDLTNAGKVRLARFTTGS